MKPIPSITSITFLKTKSHNLNKKPKIEHDSQKFTMILTDVKNSKFLFVTIKINDTMPLKINKRQKTAAIKTSWSILI